MNWVCEKEVIPDLLSFSETVIEKKSDTCRWLSAKLEPANQLRYPLIRRSLVGYAMMTIPLSFRHSMIGAIAVPGLEWRRPSALREGAGSPSAWSVPQIFRKHSFALLVFGVGHFRGSQTPFSSRGDFGSMFARTYLDCRLYKA
jgi:hypothetical protein